MPSSQLNEKERRQQAAGRKKETTLMHIFLARTSGLWENWSGERFKVRWGEGSRVSSLTFVVRLSVWALFRFCLGFVFHLRLTCIDYA